MLRSVGIGFALALGCVPASFGQQAVQWRVEDGGNGHWYAYEPPTTRNWFGWRDYAVGRGGYLATITTAEERLWVCEAVLGSLPGSTNGGNALLGGYQELADPEPLGFRWVTGEAFGYHAFGPGNPSDSHDFDGNGEDALAMYGPGGDAGGSSGYNCRWNDVSLLGQGQGAIIEWSADCNGDGIIDYGQILQGQLVDADSNGIPDTCEVDPCPGDVVESGSVNGIDLAAILAYWGTNGGKFPRTDANGDGTVDAGDLSIVLAGWGNCPD